MMRWFFVGRSTLTNYGLWVTDGTGAGTHELTGIDGANASGVLAAAATRRGGKFKVNTRLILCATICSQFTRPDLGGGRW